jgi:type II secretory pathway pseudopilin PulG
MLQRRQHDTQESGYMLLAVVVMAAVILIGLAVAAPIISYSIRRDKEVEAEHRANEYVRAIQLFYRKNNGYPPSIKALEGTNNVRYLRHQFVDPLTGKADWRLIHQGEQKTTIKGFFGQELTGIAGGGGGLGSAAGLANPIGAAGSAGTPNSTINAGGLAGGFNGATIGGSSGSTGSTGASGSTGSGTGMFGDSTGGIIVGVGTSRTGSSILTPNAQDTYETWEFWYDPRIELMKKNVNILGGGISSTSATSLGSSGSTGAFGAPTGFNGNAPATGPTNNGNGNSSNTNSAPPQQ